MKLQARGGELNWMMKTQQTCALARLSALGTTPLLAERTIPPAPPGSPTSTNCQLRVNGRLCPVFDRRVFLELNNPDRIVSWSQFDFTGKAHVEVVVPLGGKKFHIQALTNSHPERPVDRVKVVTALRPEVPIVLGMTLGIEEGISIQRMPANQNQ